MTTFGATLHGLHPRDPELVQATRDLARGRTTTREVEAARASQRKRLAALQTEVGTAYASDGQLHWADLFRPLVEAADGLEVGALTRFLDTNTFYKAPRVTGTPALPDGLPPAAFPGPWADGPRVATLPSPWFLARAAEGSADAADIAADVLAPAIQRLDADLVVLHEPWAASHGLPRDDADAFHASLEALPGSAILHLYGGPATGEGAPGTRTAEGPTASPLALALDSGLAGVGVDFLATDLDAAADADWGDATLLAGVADARNSLVEQPEPLAAFLQRAADATGAPQVLATHTWSLEFVPADIAEAKVRALGEAARLAGGSP